MNLPPGQQLAAPRKWPLVGERTPATSSGEWRVTVAGCVEQPAVFTLAELKSLPRREQTIDIHCVTRWSKLAVPFAGVALADLLIRVKPMADARYISFVAHSERRHSTSLALDDALTLDALVAFEAEHRPLAVEHGGPVRVVVPGRYFYKSVKWLTQIELLANDRLGYWEAEAGYHNVADPWREERYMAPDLTKQEMQRVLAGRDFAGRQLRSLQARGHELVGLNARDAVLRDADFRDCLLERACFDGANLANARFAGASLRGATFVGADLEGADFTAADLRGADLRQASLFGATFVQPGEHTAAPLGAMLDDTTQIDAMSLEQLAPPQAEFLERNTRPGSSR